MTRHLPAHRTGSATTRAAASGPTSLLTPLVRPGQVLTSVESGLGYRIGPPLGRGGYGQAFIAARLGRSTRVPARVCVKVSTRQDGWLREAYFGLMLQGHARAIQVFDVFPELGEDRMLYCLALEYAPHGDLSAFLARRETDWKETVVRREITAVLDVLRRLHRGQMLHRDLTPMNVFVCEGHRLKLGDFGIVRPQGDRSGVPARTLNRLHAPTDIFGAAAPKWQARDDVYQMGQLIGMLVRGDASSRVRPGDVRALDCSDHLKEIIYRCIGERRKRYESADELVDALSRPAVRMRTGGVRSLQGVHLAFTGFLSVPRATAASAARRAGATVHAGASAKTNVIVRGRPNPRQAAGKDGGRKLLEIKRLKEKGVRVSLITEAQFWKLAGGPPPVRRAAGTRSHGTSDSGR